MNLKYEIGIGKHLISDESWKKISKIKGWTTLDEARFIAYVACNSGADLIVEVGCYHGRGTHILRHGNIEAHLLCIDPFEDGYIHGDMHIGEEDYKEFCKNVDITSSGDDLGKFYDMSFVRSTAPLVAPKIQGTVGLLYIDGNHEYPHPMNDFLAFYDNGKLDGKSVIIFDDYCPGWPGVERSVKELEDRELIVSQKFGRFAVAQIW